MSRHPQIEVIVQELYTGLQALYGERLAQVILYGSQARDEAEPDSDIDVMIVVESPLDRSAEMERTSRLVAALSLKYDVVITPIIISSQQYQRDNQALIRNVRKEGRVLS